MAWTEDDDRQAGNSVTNSEQSHEAGTTQAVESKVMDTLKEVLGEQVIERRRQRRWKIFFRFVYLFVFLGLVSVYFLQPEAEDMSSGADSVAIIRMQGEIGAQGDINANDYVSVLQDAYASSTTRAVLIEMNSPGGSPVHAGILHDAIMKYRSQYPEIPVVVVVEDMAASGGYYIASAADKIVVDKASLVGSIGVISGGFEMSGLIEKLGVKRRLFTAGENKAFLDPFSPMTDKAAASWQGVLDETHQQFIAAVKEGRGDKIADDPILYSGMVFTGSQAVEYGLADEFGYAQELLNGEFSNLTPAYYSPYQEPLEKLAEQLGVSFATQVKTWLMDMR